MRRNSAISRVSHTTGDNAKLHGLKLAATEQPAGTAVLVIQGNAWLASTLIERMEPIRQAGADVIVYDFRGYGRSTGKRRLAAMAADYRNILESLSTHYSRVSVYAFSFGGVLLLNSGVDFGRLHSVVLDAVPSSVKPFNCSRDYDPSHRLPSDCPNFVARASTLDPVVPPAKSDALLNLITQCGGQVLRSESKYHPFQDEPETSEELRVDSLVPVLVAIERGRP